MADESTAKTTTVSLEDYTKAMQTLEAERERARKFEGQVVDLQKKFEPYSKVDLEALKAAKEEAELLKKEQAANDPKKLEELHQKAINDVRAQWQKDKEALEAKVGSLSAKTKELEVVDKAHSQIGKFFNDDCQDDVKAKIRQNIDVRDDGQFVIKDEKGEPRYSKADRTKLMSVAEYADELKEQKPSWAKPTHAAGGMQAGTRITSVGDLTLDKYDRMTPQERQALPIEVRHKMASASVARPLA